MLQFFTVSNLLSNLLLSCSLCSPPPEGSSLSWQHQGHKVHDLLLHLLLLQLWPWLHLPLLHRCLLLLPNVLALLLQLWPRLLLLLRLHRQRLLRKEGRHVSGRSRGVSRALEGWEQ